MEMVAPYPPGVIAVPGRIPGTAFFPGGAGLWDVDPTAVPPTLPPLPIGGVMVLGHDFHSEAGFLASLDQRTEVPRVRERGYRIAPTWIALQRLFAEAAIPLHACFFTNAYMGLRAGAQTTGRFPGARDSGFVVRCQQFFLRQMAVQRPALILTLGAWVPAFLAPLAPALTPWCRARSLAAIDSAGPLVSAVSFREGAPVATAVSAARAVGTVLLASPPPCTVAALTHPSLRGPNVGHRRFGGHVGHAAELTLLKAATRAAGIVSCVA